MREGKVESNNRGLIALLCVLVVVIVGLVTGIIIVENNNTAEENSQNEEDEVVYFDTNMDGEGLAAYGEYLEYYDEVRAKAKELMEIDPVDIEAVRNLYNEAIAKYAAENGYSEVQAFVLAEKEDLLSGGFKREALDALTVVDYSYFPEPAQHRIYNEIIDLAKELGDAVVVAKYEPLAEATKEAFESSDEAIRETATEFEGGEIVQEVE